MLLVFSAFAMAQAPSGKWTGNAAPNIGTVSRCNPNLAFELVAENGKLTGKLDFGNRVQEIEAAVAPDGKFETSFVNPFGTTVKVFGKLDEAFTVVNPKWCGWGDMPLKR
jgi:hypothetical protein